MASFYADENFDHPTVEALRSLGHDVITVQDAGRRGDSDDQVLAFATQHGRAVLTHDRRDFERLHSTPITQASSVAHRMTPPRSRHESTRRSRRGLSLGSTFA